MLGRGLAFLRLWGGDCKSDEGKDMGNAEARSRVRRKRKGNAKEGETSQLSLSQQNVYKGM